MIDVVARLDRATQYAGLYRLKHRSLGYWITRLPPSLKLRRAELSNPAEALA
jgi:hypothetical protein